MKPLSSWLPSIAAFAVTFAVASLLSCFTYWLAHYPAKSVQSLRAIFSVVASFVVTLTPAMMAPHSLPAFAALVAGISCLQALLERAIERSSPTLEHGAPTFKHYFARCLLTYISTLFIAQWMTFPLITLVARTSARATSVVWTWDLDAAFYGFVAGLVIAPLSISFYRRMFQSLALRPGIDRGLHEEELLS